MIESWVIVTFSIEKQLFSIHFRFSTILPFYLFFFILWINFNFDTFISEFGFSALLWMILIFSIKTPDTLSKLPLNLKFYQYFEYCLLENWNVLTNFSNWSQFEARIQCNLLCHVAFYSLCFDSTILSSNLVSLIRIEMNSVWKWGKKEKFQSFLNIKWISITEKWHQNEMINIL